MKVPQGPVGRAVQRVLPQEAAYGNKDHDDILQAAEIAVWKRTAADPAGRAELSPGEQYTTARWAAMDQLRRAMGLRRTEAEPLSLEAAQEAWGADLPAPEVPVDLRLDVARALAQLDPVDAAWVRAWLLDGVPAKEAAGHVGMPYSAMQTRWSRQLRAKLARLLEEYRR